MSNSKLLSNVASNLANSSGKILTVANGEIVWEENYALETANLAYARANNISIPFFTYNNSSNNINLTSDDKIPFFVYSGESSNISIIKV